MEPQETNNEKRDSDQFEGIEIVGRSIEDIDELEYDDREGEKMEEETEDASVKKNELKGPDSGKDLMTKSPIDNSGPKRNSELNDPLAKTLVFQPQADDGKMLDSISGEMLKTEEELIDKKRLSFNYLKQWNTKGQFLVSIQKNLADRFIEKLYKFAENSLENQPTVIKHFVDRSAQEEKYASQKLISLDKLYLRQDPEGLEYESLNEVMKLFHELHNTNNMGSLSNANTLDQLVKRQLMETNREYMNRLTYFRENLSTLKKQVKTASAEMNERFLEYCKEFSECNKIFFQHKRRIDHDLSFFELSFIAAANQCYSLTKSYTRTTIQFWTEIKRLEIKWIENVKSVLDQHEKMQRDRFKKGHRLSGILKPFFDWKFGEEFEDSIVDVPSLLSPDEQVYLRKKLNLAADSNLKFKEIYGFFENFAPLSLGSRPLIALQLGVDRRRNSLISKVSKNEVWQTCKILITADNFLLVIEDDCKRPSKSIKLNLITCKFTPDLSVELTALQPKKMFLSGVQTIKFKLSSELEKEKLHELLSKLRK